MRCIKASNELIAPLGALVGEKEYGEAAVRSRYVPVLLSVPLGGKCPGHSCRIWLGSHSPSVLYRGSDGGYGLGQPWRQLRQASVSRRARSHCFDRHPEGAVGSRRYAPGTANISIAGSSLAH